MRSALFSLKIVDVLALFCIFSDAFYDISFSFKEFNRDNMFWF